MTTFQIDGQHVALTQRSDGTWGCVGGINVNVTAAIHDWLVNVPHKRPRVLAMVGLNVGTAVAALALTTWATLDDEMNGYCAKRGLTCTAKDFEAAKPECVDCGCSLVGKRAFGDFGSCEDCYTGAAHTAAEMDREDRYTRGAEGGWCDL